MDQQSARKIFTYQLLPTPEQEQAMAMVVWRCRAHAPGGDMPDRSEPTEQADQSPHDALTVSVF